MAEKKGEADAKAAAAATPTSNAPEKLKESFKGGTAARSATKAVAAKAGTIGTAVVAFLLLSILVFVYIPYWKNDAGSNESAAKPSSTTPAPASQPGTVPQAPAYGARGTVAEARITWAQPNADGTLPVGVWSEPFRIPIGCVLHTDGGNGITFLMEYRWEHERGWNRLQPKQQDAPGNLVRLMILEAARGVKNPPVSIKC